VLKKKGFLTSTVHIPTKAVLDDSLITVDTTSLDQRASKEVTRVTIKIQELRYPRLFIFLPMT